MEGQRACRPQGKTIALDKVDCRHEQLTFLGSRLIYHSFIHLENRNSNSLPNTLKSPLKPRSRDFGQSSPAFCCGVVQLSSLSSVNKNQSKNGIIGHCDLPKLSSLEAINLISARKQQLILSIRQRAAPCFIWHNSHWAAQCFDQQT